MEESRKQFQKWWEEFYETQPREPWSEIYSPEHDYFVDQDIDGQYDAWKASRASIEIEFPDELTIDDCIEKVIDVSYATRFNIGMGKLEEIIRAAGLKIKGGNDDNSKSHL